MPAVRIGISGWTYPPWRGGFYPERLRQQDELNYASRQVNSIEINGTFYSLQTPKSFARWADETPDDFVFAVKAPRFITHIKRLREIEAPLANFFASGVLRLGVKLGPILWQFPPSFHYDKALLENFFALLPHDTDAAAALAGRHDDHLRGRGWLQAEHRGRLRHAIEIRHNSFVQPEFAALLRRYGIALVCADTVEWPRLMDVTSDFVYCRLHGSEELYRSGYDDAALDLWAARVRAWRDGRMPPESVYADDARAADPCDVFVYFDNTDKRRAPRDAQTLRAKL
jgi:uncharacterized protein YecE (DUF72 family)